jgi:hypothetical protein
MDAGAGRLSHPSSHVVRRAPANLVGALSVQGNPLKRQRKEKLKEEIEQVCCQTGHTQAKGSSTSSLQSRLERPFAILKKTISAVVWVDRLAETLIKYREEILGFVSELVNNSWPF